MEKSNLRVPVSSLKVYFIKSHLLCDLQNWILYISCFRVSQVFECCGQDDLSFTLKSVKNMLVLSKPETLVYFKSLCL